MPIIAGFLLGPRVNAGGRVGRSDLGARLLATEDPVLRRRPRAASSTSTTTSGARIETEVQEAATAPGRSAGGGAIRICCSSRRRGWHPGVIGIVAGRLKERYQRPVCVIALENGVGKALRPLGRGACISGRPSSPRARRDWC